MPLIELHTEISAPRERVFDLARSVDAHLDSAGATRERAVAGVTSGLIGSGEEAPELNPYPRRMVIFFYLPILLLLAAGFALGYLPARLLGRRTNQGPFWGNSDTFAVLASAAGTAAGFLFAGVSGFDRFALAPERVRDVWMNSGQAFVFELAQPIFSGVVCALVVILLGRFSPRWVARSGRVPPLAGLLISFADFLLWPVIFGPFVS